MKPDRSQPAASSTMPESAGVTRYGREMTPRQRQSAQDTNNSMALADKPYEPPKLPENIMAYNYGLGNQAKQSRETYRPMRRNYVTLYLRARRKHHELLLWQFITSGIFTKDQMYMPQALPFWTVGTRLRLRINFPMGRMMEAMKCRLGITNPGLRFCLDGFFGMMNYTDIFGNTADACPWMEMSNFSTVSSLRLADGDSIFVSIASAAQIEKVATWRLKRSIDLAAADAKNFAAAARQQEATAAAAAADTEEPEENQVISAA